MNNTIYANSDEKFVKANILFSSENKIYYNEECTEEVTLEDAFNFFKKGLMLIYVDGGFKRPIGINITEGGYTVSYGENGSSFVFPDPESDDINKVVYFNGTGVRWKDIPSLISDLGYMLVHKPTSEQEGYILKVVSGEPAWVSAI